MKYWLIPSTVGYEYARTGEYPFTEFLDIDTNEWIRDDRLWGEIHFTGDWGVSTEAEAEASRHAQATTRLTKLFPLNAP